MNMPRITRTLVPLILFTSSAICFSIVERPNNLFLKQPNYHVTEIGKGGSSSLRTRHVNLNNNNIGNKPIAKTDFHIIPYVTTTLVDGDLLFDPVTSQFVSRTIPKRTHANHADNKKKLTDYYKTKVNKPNVQKQHFKEKSNVLPTNINIKFKYPEVQPRSFSQKISYSPTFHPAPKVLKPEANSYKNLISQKYYNDDKTHEPNFFFDDFLNSKPAAIPKTQSNNGELKSDHEIPKFVPVKPIYPGEGKWAVRGKKYKPYVGKQIYSQLDDTIEHPEAEEIFQGTKIIFEEQQKKFSKNFLTSGNQKAQSATIYPKYNSSYKNTGKLPLKGSKSRSSQTPENIDNSEKTEETSEEQEQEFVPTRTLAQVRQYENVEHNLPPIEPRLREIVKDSKTHTVFTEEGYEDMAYDHADHEKNAEKGEESEEVHKMQDVLKKAFPKQTTEKSEREIENSESQQIPQTINPESQNNSFKEIASMSNDTEHSRSNNTTSNITEESPIKEKFKKEHGFRIRRSKDDVESEKGAQQPAKLYEKANSAYDSQKYPYYNGFNVYTLNNNSPLRYAENLKNRPKKKVGKMSFYEHAQKKKCQEIEEVQPIPKRIENKVQGEDDESPEDSPQHNGPRIKKLGDAIECFKEQLFGESPLDNPLFSEKIIAEPTPIFQDLESLGINSFLDAKSNGKNRRSRRHLIDSKEFKKNNNELNLPQQEALHGRRKSTKRRIRRKYPRTPFSGLNIHQNQHTTEPSATVLPKYKTISEVQYKDDIKPNEQLNVFTDVIKNIKLASGNIHDTDTKTSEKIKITTFSAPKKNKQNISFQTVLEDEEDSIFDSSDINTIVANQKPKSDLHRHEQFLHEKPFINDHESIPNELFHKSPITTTVKTNNFFILGMKPPPSLPSSYLGSTKVFNRKFYRNKGPTRRWSHRILKRNAAMPLYSQIRRKTTTETTTETDDYIPRRNRNYHYDEKTGKIIYYTTQASLIEEIEPEVIAEQYIPPKRITTEKPAKVTTERQELKGPSFLEFVSKLKSHDGYISIPDPKPVKTEKEASTTTTQKPASTTEPEFLKILKKVKNDPDYKVIGKKNVSTTTPANEEEQKYTEEKEVLQSQNVPVQNSPGGSLMTHSVPNPSNISLEIGTLKIFDINEYIPRPRNYNFSSFINTSKYSTIKRNPVAVKQEEENEDGIKSENVRVDTENIKLEALRAESDKTEETTKSTTEQLNKGADEEKLPSTEVQEKVKEEPKRNSRRFGTKTRTQRINRDEVKDRRFRDESTTERLTEVEPKRSVRRYRIRPKARNEHTNETKVNEEVEKQDTKEIQSYENIRNRRSWNKPKESPSQNYEKRSKRKRREEPRYVTESDAPDLISSSITTVVPEITAPTIRSRGRTRHRTSYRTTPAPRYRRGRRTRPTIAATSAAYTESVTTPYSVVSKRRRRPISRISSASPSSPPPSTPLPLIPTENNSSVSTPNEETSPVSPTTPLTLETVELENKQRESITNTGDFSHVSARKVHDDVKVQDVEVFKDYDKTQKHGGNYKGINDADVVTLDPDGLEEAKESMKEDKVTEGPLVLDLYPTEKEPPEDQYLSKEERKKEPKRDGGNQLQNFGKETENNVFEQHQNNQIKPYEVVENREIPDTLEEEPIINGPTNGYTNIEEEKKISPIQPREEYLNERTESRIIGSQIPANSFFGQEETLTGIETTTATTTVFYSTSAPSNFGEENDKLVVQVFDFPSTLEIPTSTTKTTELDALETASASYFSVNDLKQQSHQHNQQQQLPHQHNQQQQVPHQQHQLPHQQQQLPHQQPQVPHRHHQEQQPPHEHHQQHQLPRQHHKEQQLPHQYHKEQQLPHQHDQQQQLPNQHHQQVQQQQHQKPPHDQHNHHLRHPQNRQQARQYHHHHHQRRQQKQKAPQQHRQPQQHQPLQQHQQSQQQHEHHRPQKLLHQRLQEQQRQHQPPQEHPQQPQHQPPQELLHQRLQEQQQHQPPQEQQQQQLHQPPQEQQQQQQHQTPQELQQQQQHQPPQEQQQQEQHQTPQELQQQPHQPPHKLPQQIISDRNANNQTYYNGNITPEKNADEVVTSTTSPEYMLNSGGKQFPPKESASLKTDNGEMLAKKPMVDFTDPPIIHRTVKKRIRIKPNNFDFTTTTPGYEEHRKPKESVIVESNAGRQEPIEEEPTLPHNVVTEPTLRQFENGNDTVLNQNIETRTKIYSNIQFDRNPHEPVSHHPPPMNRNEYHKQEVPSTSTPTEPIHFDPKYVTKMPDVQQQEEIEAPPRNFYQADKEEQLPLYLHSKEEQLPKDPYDYRRIEEERPPPENIQHTTHRPVKKFKNSPERINRIVSSTEKFFFIKDPSKRNYFYAPI